MTRILPALLALLLVSLPSSAQAEGWRPALPADETAAEWLKRLDSRLAPVHGAILGTLELVDAGSAVERDAYIVIIQEQAIRGIVVLDEMEPAPACARDYAALERIMLLAFGDAADAYRQAQAGSTQARAEVAALVPAAIYLLTSYGQAIRAATVCEAPLAAVSATPADTPRPERTATPIATPEG